MKREKKCLDGAGGTREEQENVAKNEAHVKNRQEWEKNICLLMPQAVNSDSVCVCVQTRGPSSLFPV